jgi:hypothetical protein
MIVMNAIDMNETVSALLILFVIALGGFLIFGGANWISNMRTERAIRKNVPLPAGAKWYYGLDGLILYVDVNHGTGKDPDWRRTLKFLNRIDVEYGNNLFPDDFLDDSKTNVLRLAEWMREQYINSDEFTTLVPFPLEEGAWEIKYEPNSYEIGVNGFHLVTHGNGFMDYSRGFGDHRDAVVASIRTIPLLRKEEADEIEKARQLRSMERILSEAKPAVTTREYKPV